MLDYNVLNYYQRLTFIFQYIQIIIAIPGIIGNILIIFVFLRKRFRKYSYAFYSIVMACSDIVVLITSIRHWSAIILDANIDLVAPFFCTIGEYLPYVAGTISLWLLALISLDRFLTIVYSNRFGIFKKRWLQIMFVIVLVVYSLLIHIQLPLSYNLVVLSSNETNSSLACVLESQNVATIHSSIFLANTFLVILIVNNILSGKMVWFLISTRKRLSVNIGRVNSTVKDRKFAISSIGLNICCMVCKMPLSVGLLVAQNQALSPDFGQLLFTIFVAIYTIDNAAVFVVYISVNSIFYEEFLKMIRVLRFQTTSSNSSANNANSLARNTY